MQLVLSVSTVADVDVGAALSLVSSFVILGLVLLGIAGMVEAGTLARNGAIGIRTRATKASDRAWTVGHQAAHGAMRVTGVLCLVFAVLIVLLALVVRGAQAVLVVLGAAGVGYLALATGLVVIVLRANAAARGSTPPPR